jgi:prepilin-type N-terminal cleavage/methylation domain-containing protein
MVRGHRSPRARGLTLLEVILAITIIALMMVALGTFMRRTLDIREQVIKESDRTQIARSFLESLAAELRAIPGGEQLNFPVEQRLVGDRRSISFLTTTLPERERFVFYQDTDEPPPAAHDVRLVTYDLWVDGDETTEDGNPLVGGITRTLRQTLSQAVIDEDDPLTERTDVWAPELDYLEFRYFDGVQWRTDWTFTEGNALPQMIQITVGYDQISMYEYEDFDLDDFPVEEYPLGPEEPHNPDRFSVLIRMPTADRFFNSRLQTLGDSLAEQFDVEGLMQ